MCSPDVVDKLLRPLDEQTFDRYHKSLLGRVEANQHSALAVEVCRDAGEGKGKGIVASQDISEGTVLFRDVPLVAEQHSRNRKLALVCDHCFRYCGPLELQLGFRLLHCKPPPGVADPHSTALALLDGTMTLPHLLDAYQPSSPSQAGSTVDTDAFIDCVVPLHLRKLSDAAQRAQGDSASSADNSDFAAAASATSQCDSSQTRSPLGRAIMLPDGSPYVFCSHDCAALAWVSWASVLSPGPGSSPHEPGLSHAKGRSVVDGAAASSQPTSKRSDMSYAGDALPDTVRNSVHVAAFDLQQVSERVVHCCTLAGLVDTFGQDSDAAATSRSNAALPRPPWLPPAAAAATPALRAFYDHADATNDAFRVAARAVALTATSAHLHACLRGTQAGLAPGRHNVTDKGTACKTGNNSGLSCPGVAWGDLVSAWTPFQAVHRKVWWEHVPVPDDFDGDEPAWRQHLKDLAHESLLHLRTALQGVVPDALLHERVWGSLLGAFELNNLDLCVQSPVELYFLAADDLEEPKRAEVQAVTQPLLDALDVEYDACVEGTALYALQSCINHADDPNAHAIKGDADTDGRAVLTATRDIASGEEVCISYVDMDGSASARITALRDYDVPA